MIDTSSWKEYKMSDIGFKIYHGIRQKKSERTEGSIPLLTAGKENQGVATYIGNPASLYIDPITVDMFGNSFFHKGEYAGDDNIYFFINDEISDEVKIFIATIINTCNTQKYSFKDQFRQPQADSLTVFLPATSESQPNWEYMNSYIKQIMGESEKHIENLKKVDNTKHLIDTSNWGKFKIESLFDKLDLKCLKNKFNKILDCSEERTNEFSLPLTNAKHFNNGIQFYGRPNEWDSAEMTIDIVSNGACATGDVYAQPQRTGVLWDSYLIKCKHNITSELVLHYMACVIQRCIKQYFGWNDKCVWDKVKEQYIKLPITSNGEPNWQYMENYMQIIMSKAERTINELTIS